MAPRVDNHYATLGVSRSASPQQIRAAYRDLARELHPDRHLDSPPAERARAERVMRKVNDAWMVLGDPARKEAYDRQLVAATAPPASTPSPPPSAAPRSSPRPVAHDVDHEAEDDTDLAEVGPLGAFTLRFLPIALLVGVVFLLIVVTAFAGNQGDDSLDDAGPTDVGGLEVIGCAVLDEIGGVVYPQLVGCSVAFDVMVVGEAASALGCPADVEAVAFGDHVLCVVHPDDPRLADSGGVGSSR